MKKILIVAGDPSGDIIAGQLIDSLRKLNPQIEITGIGGKNIQKKSDHFLANIVEQHALGFSISLKKILFFKNVLNKIIEPELLKNKPDAVIPIDFYGFNSRVAQTAKKNGCKVFYYVSPQFWASRPGRAERLRQSVDLFLCLFPFELEFYGKRNIPAQFVGHPLLDHLPQVDKDHLPPPRIESNIGLLPGSRPEEISRHLPVIIRACEIISKEVPGTRFLLFTVPHVSRDLYINLIGTAKSNCLIELIQDENYVWRSQLDLAITASGMETLENTLLGIPMVVMYKTNWITYCIARMIIQIPFLGMPNLLSQKQIVPEFIQSKATGENIAKPIIHWLKNPQERITLKKELLTLRDKFGQGGASDRAAKTILEKVA